MRLRSRAPGRICLFGEHQDYMGFPVIAAAIDLTIDIHGTVVPGERVRLQLPDLGETEDFSCLDFTYTRPRDYFRSTVRVLQKQGLFSAMEIDARVRGTIPIQAGTSSSSALVVAWCGFLLFAQGRRSEWEDDPTRVGELAYLAEVAEFHESGGRMDQFTSAAGGIVFIEFDGKTVLQRLPAHMKAFVLGDSHQPKDTLKTLRRIRSGQEGGLREIQRHIPADTLHRLGASDIDGILPRISPEFRPYLRAVLLNRSITLDAHAELSRPHPDIDRLCLWMNRHHEVLRDDLAISTPKIERMIESALTAGAKAAKINGSGEGGCMFAFCPGRQEAVAEAVRAAGGTPYVINVGEGLHVQEIE